MSGTKIFGILDLPDERLHSVLYLVCYLCRSGERHRDSPTGKDIFELPFVLVETFLLLLFSSITYGMAAIAMYKKQQKAGDLLAGVDMICLVPDLSGWKSYEFHHLIVNGMGRDRSGFLSAFFALVGLRSARHFRSYLDGGADGANRPSRPDQH